MQTLTQNTSPPQSTACKRLGVIAGDGKLPELLAKRAREKGMVVVSLAMSAEAKARLTPHSEQVYEIFPGQIGRNLKLLRENKCDSVVFCGKVPKLDMLKNVTKIDWVAIRELSRLPDFKDDTIQRHIGDWMELEGFKVLTQTEFLSHLYQEVGVLTKNKPDAFQYADIDFGFKIAKESARLEIGQTLVVYDRMVIAVEAAEGTDRTIQRAVQINKGPVTVIKVARPIQDQRFDIPTVGMSTLQAMLGSKLGGVLAIEAGQILMVDEQAMIEFANRNEIVIVAV
ncbi:UDP-2,3-diacylglucosamine diphosphatase LpxI [bacterium]|nr:UDP-2,3-diacylglucosamine diphosphatase LpxI [bacterium]QQR57258.1 MAG: UDP-2,3-diacylglucosamine diphosphatase LpxI [Candidatus Melainabacteria bacterium]